MFAHVLVHSHEGYGTLRPESTQLLDLDRHLLLIGPLHLALGLSRDGRERRDL